VWAAVESTAAVSPSVVTLDIRVRLLVDTAVTGVPATATDTPPLAVRLTDLRAFTS